MMRHLSARLSASSPIRGPSLAWSRLRSIVPICGAVVLSACTIAPDDLTIEDHLSRARSDLQAMTSAQDQDPVASPLTLHDAMARAVKYNLDHRLAMMETALQQGVHDVSHWDLLPRVTAETGYTGRSEADSSANLNQETGEITLQPTISEERDNTSSELGVVWNVLDFGVSYFETRQNANRVKVLEERRRKAVQNLIQQVRHAFWLAASAESLEAPLREILAEARDAREDAKSVEEQGLNLPIDALRYQKNLLNVIRQLEDLQQEMAQARLDLAKLMGLPLDRVEALELQLGVDTGTIPEISMPMAEMEMLALVNRPELREEDYQALIARDEVNKAIARAFPGIEFSLSRNWDDNDFLVENTWTSSGLKIAWNLINLASTPTRIERAEAQKDVAETRRLALSMAVLSQVYIARHNYRRSVQRHERAVELAGINERIFRHTENASRSSSDSALDRVQAAVTSFLSQMEVARSYAEVHNAVARVHLSAGVDNLPKEIPTGDTKSLAAALRRADEKLLAQGPDLPVVLASAEPFGAAAEVALATEARAAAEVDNAPAAVAIELRDPEPESGDNGETDNLPAAAEPGDHPVAPASEADHAERSWVVAAGVYARRANADRVQDRLAALGVPHYARGDIESGNAAVRMVFAGPFFSADEALAARGRIEGDGLPAMILRLEARNAVVASVGDLSR